MVWFASAPLERADQLLVRRPFPAILKAALRPTVGSRRPDVASSSGVRLPPQRSQDRAPFSGFIGLSQRVFNGATVGPATGPFALQLAAVLRAKGVEALDRDPVEAHSVDFVALLILGDPLFECGLDHGQHSLSMAARVAWLGRFQVRRDVNRSGGHRQALITAKGERNPAIEARRPARRSLS